MELRGQVRSAMESRNEGKLDLQTEIVHRVAKQVMAEKKVKFDTSLAP